MDWSRMAKQQLQAIAKTNLRGPIGEQLSQVVANVAKATEKEFREKIKGNPEVHRVLTAMLEADNEYYRSKRLDFEEQMNQVKKQAEAKRQLKEAEQKAAEKALKSVF